MGSEIKRRGESWVFVSFEFGTGLQREVTRLTLLSESTKFTLFYARGMHGALREQHVDGYLELFIGVKALKRLALAPSVSPV